MFDRCREEKRMRALLLTAAVCLAAGCAPRPQQDAWDMGPMPPVAALYDREAPPTTAEELGYYMTADLATALSAPDTPVDFDWRTWANDPEIEKQTFALSEHPPEGRADVVTRFTYPQIGGGMILTYTLCRRGPSDWKIEDIRAESATPPVSGEVPSSLRDMLGLSPRAARCE
jgi:hypothetical protein